MAAPIPPNFSLENLRKQAKALQKAWRAGEAGAFGRVRAVHPRYGDASDQQLQATKPKLTDCQLVLAREAGFDCWPQLTVAVLHHGADAMARHPDGRTPLQLASDLGLTETAALLRVMSGRSSSRP